MDDLDRKTLPLWATALCYLCRQPGAGTPDEEMDKLENQIVLAGGTRCPDRAAVLEMVRNTERKP